MPTAAELEAELIRPVQLKFHMLGWEFTAREIMVSREMAFYIPELGQRTFTFVEQLEALGFSAEESVKIAESLNPIPQKED